MKPNNFTFQEYQIWLLLHYQTRKDLSREYTRSGRKRQVYTVRSDLIKRLKGQTGFDYWTIKNAIFSIYEKLNNNENNG